MELIDDLNTCIDEKYFPLDYLEELKREGYRINKILNGYIGYLKRRKSGETINQLTKSTNQLNQPNKPINLINYSTI